MSALHTFRLGPRISLPVSRRCLIVLPLLTILLAISILAALMLGSTDTTPGDALSALFSRPEAQGDTARTIALLRLPRVMVAVLAGALLAASGYLLQIVARNGLADPGILGLSDGATLAVMATALWLPALAVGGQSLIALAGALSVAALVLTLGRNLLSGGGIILVGLAINITLGAAVEVILAAGSALQFSRLLVWTRGTLDTVDAADLRQMLLWSALLAPCLVASSRLLSPLRLGTEAAGALGLRADPARAGLILLAAACAAPVVATCGPVAFVGLMAAHLARALTGDRPAEVLVTALPLGALILLWADTLGRTLFTPLTVSAGVMVSVTGVVAFLVIAALTRRPA